MTLNLLIIPRAYQLYSMTNKLYVIYYARGMEVRECNNITVLNFLSNFPVTSVLHNALIYPVSLSIDTRYITMKTTNRKERTHRF